MDMYITLKNLPLTPKAIRSSLEDVCDIVFADALSATANHRGTTQQIADVPAILHNIEESPEIKRQSA